VQTNRRISPCPGTAGRRTQTVPKFGLEFLKRLSVAESIDETIEYIEVAMTGKKNLYQTIHTMYKEMNESVRRSFFYDPPSNDPLAGVCITCRSDVWVVLDQSQLIAGT